MSSATPASDRFFASLSPEQHATYLQVEEEQGVERDRWHEIFDDELCRHLAFLGPALRVVLAHLHKQELADVGQCCIDSNPIL
jgi:hypothetical protein